MEKQKRYEHSTNSTMWTSEKKKKLHGLIVPTPILGELPTQRSVKLYKNQVMTFYYSVTLRTPYTIAAVGSNARG